MCAVDGYDVATTCTVTVQYAASWRLVVCGACPSSTMQQVSHGPESSPIAPSFSVPAVALCSQNFGCPGMVNDQGVLVDGMRRRRRYTGENNNSSWMACMWLTCGPGPAQSLSGCSAVLEWQPYMWLQQHHHPLCVRALCLPQAVPRPLKP